MSLFAAARSLLGHAWPVLVAQLASVGMMVIDTAVLGHVSAADLAAVAIGGGIHVSIVFALVGILQAVAPVVAQLHGAGRDGEVAGVLQQGFWLACLLALPGMACLLAPGALLTPFDVDPAVDRKVREYLALLAWGLLPALCYRTFYAFCNALGRPRVLMAIGVVALLLHGGLAWGFAARGWAGEPLGVAGCALSNVIIAWLAFAAGSAYLALGPLRRLRPFAGWRPPHWPTWRELLRIGLPMGFSNFVEISAFTLVALFIAALGPDVVAGHRIVANLSALSYMLPLSLGIAVLSAVGLSIGRRDWLAVRRSVHAALGLAAGLSLVLGLLLWAFAETLGTLYTDDPAVAAIAISLIVYIAIYQFVDALQTVAGHVLRACRVTFVPMLVQTVCFWGIGLGLGSWLCYRGPMLGVAGFWLAAVLSLVAAAGLLLPLMFKALRSLEQAP